MSRGVAVVVTAVLLAVSAVGQTAGPGLSAAETRVVERKIAGMKTPEERKAAGDWSDAKKVAEAICKPMALVKLKRKGADQVVLGNEAADSLVLESATRLTGWGQYLTAEGWKYISFVCDVNSATGKASKFTSAPAAVSRQSMV